MTMWAHFSTRAVRPILSYCLILPASTSIYLAARATTGAMRRNVSNSALRKFETLSEIERKPAAVLRPVVRSPTSVPPAHAR